MKIVLKLIYVSMLTTKGSKSTKIFQRLKHRYSKNQAKKVSQCMINLIYNQHIENASTFIDAEIRQMHKLWDE